MKKLRFALLGCGRISSRHVDAIVANSEKAELIAVFDVVRDLAVDKKNYYEQKVTGSYVRVYDNYSNFLKDDNIDIVTIATISGYHAQHAVDCLNHNKHILIEKPMALNLEDVDRIIELSEKVNKKVCVSHQNRFIPSIQKLKEAVDQNKFGKIIHGSARTLWNRNDDYYKQASWRGTKNLDGGTLLNQCIHNIDLLQWLLGGEIERVTSEVDTFIRDIETEDFGALLLRFKNGSIGVVEGSVCTYPKNLEETLSIYGEKGTVVIRNGAVKTWEFEDPEFLPPKGCVINEGHIPLYKNFISSVLNNTQPLIDGVEGSKVLRILVNE